MLNKIKKVSEVSFLEHASLALLCSAVRNPSLELPISDVTYAIISKNMIELAEQFCDDAAERVQQIASK